MLEFLTILRNRTCVQVRQWLSMSYKTRHFLYIYIEGHRWVNIDLVLYPWQSQVVTRAYHNAPAPHQILWYMYIFVLYLSKYYAILSTWSGRWLNANYKELHHTQREWERIQTGHRKQVFWMTQITKCLRDTCMDIHIHVQVISARKARLLQLTTPILKGGFFKSNGEKIFLLFD